MSEWKKCRIGDLVTLRQGFAINAKSKHYISKERTSLALLRIADMKSGSREIFIREDIPQNFIARAEDIVYTRTGNVGLVFRNNYGVVHNNCFTVTPNDEKALSRDFLYYLLQSKSFFDKANSLARGAAQPDLPHSLFNSIEISYPELDCQHRIATILSRYDSLIENYQKQIKLLEEAAQRLYKEWFVDLHFPGHENTKIVDGVPEGWTISQLGQLAEFKRGKTITKKDAIEGDIPVVAGGLAPAYYCNKSNTAERVITVSGSGANAGFTRMYFEKVWASDCSFVDASTTPFLHFVYCYLKDNKTKIDNMQKGAAQPHVYAKDINSLELCIPIESVLKSFEGKVSKYFDTISSLQSQIRLLTEARDRLLPKLMSGEIKIGM
ncbi:MAG: restriction endonuclease subunit S [Prevotella sp.]|nr:restriction endonuclease subunit S [Prevotella sp.]MBP3777395.1 restriction endonuclease subunit S [Prevotella sp.]